MPIYSGTSGTVSYFSEGSLSASNSSTSLEINFTANAATVVLAWGGHLATNADWLGGAHPGGSPYHMRFLDLDRSGGNQDRSVKSEAAFTCGVARPSPVCAGATNTYTP